MIEESYTDVLIIGAGPAGLAAAARCGEAGRKVILVDDNPWIGGQIWRGGPALAKDRQAVRLFERVELQNTISFLNGRAVLADAAARRIVLEKTNGAVVIRWSTLILTTGARELFLPFPGWTLPGIFGVGGLQALVKSGVPLENKRVVVAGSGPLLLAAAAHFEKSGAIVRIIAEQASWPRLLRFGSGLLRSPSKLFQAIQLRASLSRIRYRPGCWITRAEGDERLQRIHLTNGETSGIEECDYAAVAFGLWPNTELASLLGCELEGDAIAVDDDGRTSIEDILSAGECTGIGGLELSLVEGEIAGYTAVGNLPAARRMRRKHKRALAFARSLHHAFKLRPELKTLGNNDTIVCRCEDVTLGQLHEGSSWRAAKLHFRCGMGPCQGRICGPIVQTLFGWPMSSVRPPLFPARIGTLLTEVKSQKKELLSP